MKTRLAAAIEGQRLVHLLYDGRARTVEPHLLGRDAQGEDVFLGRQVHPWVPMEKSWQVFRLAKIYGLLVLEAVFERQPDLAGLPPHLLSDIRQAV